MLDTNSTNNGIHWTHELYDCDTGLSIMVNAYAIKGSPTEELIALLKLQDTLSSYGEMRMSVN